MPEKLSGYIRQLCLIYPDSISGISTELDILCYIEYLIALDINSVRANINKPPKITYLKKNYNFKIMILHFTGKSFKIFATYINKFNGRLDQILLNILHNAEYLMQWN